MEGFCFLRVLVLICSIFCIRINCNERNDISINDNGYRNVLIAINSKVAENDNLIPRIREAFTSGSEFLFNATRRRSYWQNITILVPKTWTPKSEYQLQVAKTETFETANVIVDREAHPEHGDKPYTKQPGGCEKRGEFIHLTPGYLLNKTNSEKNWGLEGKLLVHEWAHLRYGVFDEEYVTGSSDSTRPFYQNERGRVEGTRCSTAVKGELKHRVTQATCEPPPSQDSDDCIFVPDEDGQTATASIMYASYLNSILQFCDDEDSMNLHNRDAPNHQNTLCGERSTWNVIKSSDDFTGANLPIEDYIDTTPNFTVVQRLPRRVVLVFDTSGSMSDDLSKMLQASTNYLQYTIDQGSYVGIVEFESTPSELSPLVEITSKDSRDGLVDELPDDAGGSTGIGNGILKGIEVLNDTRFSSTFGGYLLVLTDGAENVMPYISDVLDKVEEAGVIIDTIAFTNQADPKLTELSDLTGGVASIYQGTDDISSLYDVFIATVTSRPEEADGGLPVLLVSDAVILRSQEEFIGEVAIDSSLGSETRFTFSWLEAPSTAIEVTIMDANSTEIDRSYYDRDNDLYMVTVSIPDYSQPGNWTFKIKNVDSSKEIAVTYLVQSKPSSDYSSTIEVYTYLSETRFTFDGTNQLILYAEVVKGYQPIIEAEVLAIVESPANAKYSIYLVDNGAGADIFKDDGIYSAFFTNFDENTRYGMQIQVTNSGSGLISEGINSTTGKKMYSPAEDFSRAVSGGLFEVSGYEEYVKNLNPNASSDIYPPCKIINLRIESYSQVGMNVTLRWTAPGDDLDTGTATEYDLRIANSTTSLYDNFESGTRLTNIDLIKGDLFNPKESGQTETMVVKLDQLKSSYAFAIKAIDEGGNAAEDVSNAVRLTFDIYPPSRIIDLRIESYSQDGMSVTLQWTAPGDNLDTGVAAEYDLRTADSMAMLNDSFENSTRLSNTNLIKGDLFNPKEAGQTETVVVKLDQLKNSYAFAIKAIDESGNAAADASNGVVVSFDIYPPSHIIDLRIAEYSDKEMSVTLQWTAPGDDLDAGTATEYDLRIADSMVMLNDSFDNSTRLSNTDLIQGDLFHPKEAGQTETVVVKLDQLKTPYAFAIKAIDEAGNAAADGSNGVMVTLGVQCEPTESNSGIAWWAWLLFVVVVLVFVIMGLGLIVCVWRKTDSYLVNKRTKNVIV